jgi:superfamily I DNA/RNA helicase
VLEAANAVIGQNAARHEKVLHSARGEGERVRFLRFKDEIAEALLTVEEIRKLLRLEEARPADFAILCRTQVQFRSFEAELRANGIPYVVVGGMSFFDRKEVRDVVAFLKLCVNPRGALYGQHARVGKTLDRVLAATNHGISATEAEAGGGSDPRSAAFSARRCGHRRLRAGGGGPISSCHNRFLGHPLPGRGHRLTDPLARGRTGPCSVLNFAENRAALGGTLCGLERLSSQTTTCPARRSRRPAGTR